MATTIHMPVPFSGSEEERAANRLTHMFVTFEVGEPPECSDCCARSYHTAADYPCGQEPPRQVVVIENGGNGTLGVER